MHETPQQKGRKVEIGWEESEDAGTFTPCSNRLCNAPDVGRYADYSLKLELETQD